MAFRRPKSLVLAFTGAVLLAFAAVQTADLWRRRDLALEAAQARAARLSAVIAEYVRGTFAIADTSLRQLVIHGRRVGGPSAPASEWQPILEATRASLPGNGSVSVTDREGIIRHSTLAGIVGQSRRANYIFRQMSARPIDDMLVDEPFLSPLHPGQYVLPIARRLTSRDGGFDGLVVAVVTPEAFREFFKTMSVGDEGAVSLIHPTGTVVFRQPSADNPTGASAQHHPAFVASRTSSAGLLEGPLAPGGPRFVTAFRTLPPARLAAVVSLSEHEVLAGWRQERRASLMQLAAFVATLGVFVLVLFRQMEARTRVERELDEMQKLESQRLREANEQLAAALERERQARHESEQASRLKDQFLMTLSHELRTPLNAIVGWVRMLATDSVPPERQRQALEVIERNAKTQTRLVEELLDVSRAITGKLQIDARTINPADAVLAAVETLRPAIVAKHIAFHCNIDGALDPILADPDRLQQIVWNLLSNAIKFTPDGGSVELRVAPTTSALEIVVTDSGIGIPPAFLPHVFDRFRQAESGPRREHGGLGLGLAIVRHLVELHGGTVRAESPGEGRGATFRVLLPARTTG